MIDCDDSNANRNPVAVESCGDGVDNNCNGQVDEGGMPWYPDCDGDGFTGASKEGCVKPAATSDCVAWLAKPSDRADCDDANGYHFPGAKYDLGLPSPAFNSNGGQWIDMAQPFPDARQFDGDVNCDGQVETDGLFVDQRTTGVTHQVRYLRYYPCSDVNKRKSGATSDADVCYDFAADAPSPKCGAVPIFVSYKDDVTGVCTTLRLPISIVCK